MTPLVNPDSGKSTIDRNTVTSNTGLGISGGANDHITNNDVSAGTGGISSGGKSVIDGNSITSTSGVGITGGLDDQITNNNVSSNGSDGIVGTAVSPLQGARVTGNTVSSNGGYGIHLAGASNDNTIADNSIARNTSFGIYLDVTGLTLPANESDDIERNSIDANGPAYGIEVDTGHNLVVQNKITDNFGVGVNAPGCGGCSANTVGVVVSGPGSNYTNPWSNLDYP